MRLKRRAMRGGLALLTGSALGFGAVQAMASPAPPAQAAAACDERICDLFCTALLGYQGTCVGGRCLCPL